MKPQHILLSLIGGALLPLAASAQIVTGNVSGVIGSGGNVINSTNKNVIDGNAYATNPANVVGASQYSTLIANAFGAGLGGVITFDTVVTFGGSANSITANYGAGFGELLTITQGSGGTTWNANATVANQTGVSGGVFLGGASSGNNQFRFSTGLTSFALTALWRNSDRTYTPTIYFNDSSSVTLTAFSQVGGGTSAGSVSQGPDLFFGYVAPTGKLITGVDMVGNAFVRFDDLAFTVIPEPSAFAAFGGLAALGFAAARRRRVRA